MLLINLLKNLGKIFGIVCLFFLIGGAYYLLKPTEEEKYLGQQMKMYPLGFHCTDDDGGEQVLKFDSKSQVAVYKDIYSYSMEFAIFRAEEKNPFGCVFRISRNSSAPKLIAVYIADQALDLNTARFEKSDDKDLIYKVASKSVKKDLKNIRYKVLRVFE